MEYNFWICQFQFWNGTMTKQNTRRIRPKQALNNRLKKDE